MVKKRKYGIDLLRLVLMFMVCILHTLGQGGILSASKIGTFNYKIFWLLEIISYCAVDGFAIISGYMGLDKKQKYEKISEMWIQVVFYSFILTLIFTLLGINNNFGIKEIIKCLMPVTFQKYWYFSAFFVLYLIMPAINNKIKKLNQNNAKKTLIIIIMMFSFTYIVSDPFKLKKGYSPIWLIILYCIGALAKKSKLLEKKKSITLITLWMLCILITWYTKVILKTDKLINYVSPTILLSGLLMVILFSRINIKGKIISKLTPLTFDIYLFQLNQVIWITYIANSLTKVASKNLSIGLLYVFGFAILLFTLGLLVGFIRSKIFNLIKIKLLSKKIIYLIDRILNIQIKLLK